MSAAKFITYEEGIHLLLNEVQLLNTLRVPLEEALGHCLAESIQADRDYPPFNRAAMDGIAFHLGAQAYEVMDIAGSIFAGQEWKGTLPEGSCVRIMTGAKVPSQLNCIVPVEQCLFNTEENRVRLKQGWAAQKVGQHIADKGEDTLQGSLLLKPGQKLRASEIALLATLGKASVQVYQRPSIALITTGDEVIDLHKHPKDYQIRNTNKYAISALLKTWGYELSFHAHVPDEPKQLKEAIKEADFADVLLLTGGVSMGQSDWVPSALHRCAYKEVFHKLKIKPGKPIWYGVKTQARRKSYALGLPGNPVSAQVLCRLIVKPLLDTIQGMLSPTELLMLPMGGTRKKKGELDHFFPAYIQQGKVFSTPSNGSGDVTAMIGSMGFAHHRGDCSELHAGDLVQFFPWMA